MINQDDFESIFFKVLEDLKDYLPDLVLVGGWLSYIYSNYLWNNPEIKSITTTDIDFGISPVKTKKYLHTIFDHLSSLDYQERHPQMNKMYPVILYKSGRIRLDFIASPDISKNILEKVVGSQIEINKLENFDFLLNHTLRIEIKKKRMKYLVCCPTPSAFLYHKAATFLERNDFQKQAKDLAYIYYILRYSPNMEKLFEEISQFKRNNIFPDILDKLKKYFFKKTDEGCLMVEKEFKMDFYINDLRQDIFERFQQLIDCLTSSENNKNAD